MKLIVAGSRSFTPDDQPMEEYLKFAGKVKTILDEYKRCNDLTCIVSGMAKGPDSIAAEWAIENNIPLKKFYPDWKTHGKKAGILRNIEMSKYGDSLLAFWDGKSKGTHHMIKAMEELGKFYLIMRY